MTKDTPNSKSSSISRSNILAHISDPVIAIDFDGRVLFWNEGAERLYGRTSAEMLGQPLSVVYAREWLHGEDETAIMEQIRRTGSAAGETLHLVHDGRRILVDYRAYLLQDESGQEIGFIAAIRDITASRQQEIDRIAAEKRARDEARQEWDQLRNGNVALESFLENLPAYAYVKDEQGRYLFHNRAAKAEVPTTRKSTGKTDDELFGSEASRQYRENDLAALNSGQPIRTLESLTIDGGERSFLSVKFPITDLKGSRFLGGVSMDVTEHLRDQAELRKQAALLDLANDAIFVMELDGPITYWNQGATRLYGWTAAEALGKHPSAILRSEFACSYDQVMEQFLRDGHWEGEITHHRKQGEPITVSSRWSLLRDLGGAAVAAMSINTNVTEAKVAFAELQRAEAEARARASELQVSQEKLALSESRYCALVRAGAEMVWTVPADGNQTGDIPEWQAFTGQTSHQAAGFGWADAIHPDDREHSIRAFQAAVAAGAPCELENRIRRHDGMYRNMLVRIVPVRDAAGKIVEWVGMHSDVTGQKRAEQELLQVNQRLNALMKALPVGVSFSADPSCQHVTGNPSVLAQFEVGAEDNLSASATDEAAPGRQVKFFHEGRAVSPSELPLQRAASENRLVGPVELEVHLPSGRRWTAQCYGAPIHNMEGKVAGGVAVTVDVTVRKQLEDALQQSNSRFRKLFESDLIGIGIPDRFGAFLDANDELLNTIGYTREDLQAGHVRWDTMTPPEYALRDIAHIAEAAERGSCTPYEKEYIRKDGSRVPILVGYTLLEGSRDLYIAFVLDLSAQKEAEAALHEREQRFRALAESLPQLIWVANAEGENTYCNQRFLEYTGMSPEEMMGMSWEKLLHPEDLAMTVGKWKHCLATGESYLNEYRLRRQDGEFRYFLARAVPMRNDNGDIERWIGSSTDVHDQRLAEEALRRSEKLATAGRLAATIAHEINNPLAAVTNSLYLALQEPGISEQARVYLKLADQELARVAQVTSQTLLFHRQSSSPTLVDLSEVMDSVFSLFAARFNASSIKVERQYETQEKLYCYNGELRQVFANLIGNALDATPRGGRLRIRIKNAEDGAGRRGIRILVADTGNGIPPEVRKRLFEPFVSTKSHTGTGLGLWVAESIVRKHDGRIAVRSRTDPEQHGTVFSLFLPFNGVDQSSRAE